MSMFVRITRGLHVVESSAALSHSLSFDDDAVAGDSGRHIVDEKDGARSWSWRWDETLVLPGSATAASGAPSWRTSFRSVDLDTDDEQKAGGEDKQGSEYLADPVLAADHDNEGLHASTGDKDADDPKDKTFSAGEALSTTTDVASRAIAQGDVQGNVKSPRDVDARRVENNVFSVADTMYDSTEECNEFFPTNLIEIDDKLEGGGAVIAEVTPLESSVGEKKKRGVSFWRSKKVNRSKNANTDTSVLEERSRDSGSGKKKRGKGALTAETYVAVAAADQVPKGGNSSNDLDPSDVKREEETGMKMIASVDSTSSNESGGREASVKVSETVAGGGADVGHGTPTEADNGVARKRGVSFWSPRRGNRSIPANIKSSVVDDKRRDGGPDIDTGGVGALTAETHVAVAAADEMPDDGNSSSDFDPNGVKREEGPGMKTASVESISSDESCTEASVKLSNTAVAGGGADVGRCALNETNSGVARKREVSFWSPTKGRGKKCDTTTLAKPSSDVGINWDSEASTVLEIGGQGGSDAGETDDAVPGGEKVNGSNSPKRRRKRGGGVFWSHRNKASTRSNKKEGHSDGNKKGGGADVDRHASDGHGAAATKNPHLPAYTTGKKISCEKFRRRRSRAPLKARTSPDMLLVEVWEVNGSAALKPSPMERDALVATRGYNGFEGKGFTHHVNLEETGMTDGASSGEKAPSSLISEHEQHLAATFEKNKDSPPANRGVLHTLGASPGQGRDSNEAQQGYADNVHPKAMSDEVSDVGDESSVASAVSTKIPRPRRPSVFSSPSKGRRAKKKGWLKLPANGSPVTPSISETPRNSQPAIEEGDDDHPETPAEEEGGQQGVDSLGGNGENIPERNGASDEDVGDEDDDTSVLSQAPITTELSAVIETPEKSARKKIFSSPTKGLRPNKKSLSPFGWHRSDSELLDKPPETCGEKRLLLNRGKSGKDPKPTLWGRLTIPVTNVPFSAGGGDADVMDDDGCLVNGQHVLSEGNGIKNLADSECSPDLSSTGQNVEGSSSVFGMSLPRLGLKNKPARKGVDILDGTSVAIRVTETASALFPQPSPNTSAVESWFEVGHPKGKKGKEARGRMRLTLTFYADDENCSPENIL